jgi:hypothetical protein
MRSLAGVLGAPPVRPPEPLDIDDAVGRSIAEEWRVSAASADGANQTPKSQPRKRRSR